MFNIFNNFKNYFYFQYTMLYKESEFSDIKFCQAENKNFFPFIKNMYREGEEGGEA